MNSYILADISDVMQMPHPVFGVPLGVCLLLFVLFKVFSSNQAPPSPPRNDFQSFPPQNIPPREIPPFGEHIFIGSDSCFHCGLKRDFLIRTRKQKCDGVDDIVNPKPDYEITEKVSVKEQLLSDLRKAAEMGVLTKKEYEAKRQKILDMP